MASASSRRVCTSIPSPLCFIAAIVLVSLLSRVARALELRTTEISYDPRAESFLRDCARRSIRLVANEPNARDVEQYRQKIREIIDDHDLPNAGDIIFIEVDVADYSDFESRIEVHGHVMHDQYRVLTVTGASVPNTLASLLLDIRDRTGVRPHVYFAWTEGNPVVHLLRFLLFGSGEVAPVTREVLRRAETDRSRRPHIHAG
jgi:hypothetical protein